MDWTGVFCYLFHIYVFYSLNEARVYLVVLYVYLYGLVITQSSYIS